MANSLFAASTVISERLINNCLTTYLANLAGPQSSSLTVPVSLSVGGTTHTLTLQAEFFVISARATLRPNPQGTINFTFRFHADATVLDLDQAGQTLNTFTPEIVLSTAIDLPLMALVVGNQFQLGALLSVATITALNVDVLTPVLPHPYQAALTTALADPTVLSVLTAALHTLSANGILPATNTVVPAFYDLTMQRPTFPDQQWFSARAPGLRPDLESWLSAPLRRRQRRRIHLRHTRRSQRFSAARSQRPPPDRRHSNHCQPSIPRRLPQPCRLPCHARRVPGWTASPQQLRQFLLQEHRHRCRLPRWH